MKQNLEIFDWSLTKDDYEKIDEIKQSKIFKMGPEEIWDEENYRNDMNVDQDT